MTNLSVFICACCIVLVAAVEDVFKNEANAKHILQEKYGLPADILWSDLRSFFPLSQPASTKDAGRHIQTNEQDRDTSDFAALQEALSSELAFEQRRQTGTAHDEKEEWSGAHKTAPEEDADMQVEFDHDASSLALDRLHQALPSEDERWRVVNFIAQMRGSTLLPDGDETPKADTMDLSEIADKLGLLKSSQTDLNMDLLAETSPQAPSRRRRRRRRRRRVRPTPAPTPAPTPEPKRGLPDGFEGNPPNFIGTCVVPKAENITMKAHRCGNPFMWIVGSSSKTASMYRDEMQASSLEDCAFVKAVVAKASEYKKKIILLDLLQSNESLLKIGATISAAEKSTQTPSARRRRRRYSGPARRRRRRRRAARRRRRRRVGPAPVPPQPPGGGNPGNPGAAPPPKGVFGESGCVPETEWRPVAGSEDCQNRFVARRDELQGAQLLKQKAGAVHIFDYATRNGIAKKQMCGKTCPRKYLIAQYWYPMQFHASYPDSAEEYCQKKAGQLQDYVKALSFYTKNGVCELFSECPLDQMEDASKRVHQKLQLCPWQYKSTNSFYAMNGQLVFMPDKSGVCTMKADASNKLRNSSNGFSNLDQELAIEWCLNGNGDYKGIGSNDVHSCFFDPQRRHTVDTWFRTPPVIQGRHLQYKEHPSCNLKCGAIRSWHIAELARYSRFLALPNGQCGQCRVQATFCAENEDGYTSFAGISHGNESEVISARLDLPKGKDWNLERRNYICCNVHQCVASVAEGWADANEGRKPCEEDPGDLQIENLPGVSSQHTGHYRYMQVKGNNAPNHTKTRNTCFQLKKHFRPTRDFVHWMATGESKEQLCYPRKEEVPVKGSDVCRSLATQGTCLTKPGVCKWIPPESMGECRPKMVIGSEKCESAKTTCPAGSTGRACKPPASETGCDYPWQAESMKDMPPEERRFSEAGEPKTHAVLKDDADIGPWAGLRGSTEKYNTTWHMLKEHGWKGSDGKCVTRVYSSTTGAKGQRDDFIGLACKPRPINHPKLAWNGEPCTKASTKGQCASHSEYCDWKPGPKCEFPYFHQIMSRCLHCKEFEQNEAKGSGHSREWRSRGRCRQCSTWQLYYSKVRSEFACHVLQHFHGLGPEITSRISIMEQEFGEAADHFKSPRSFAEFLFDGKRTCVRAYGGVMSGVTYSGPWKRNEEQATQKQKPADVKPHEQIDAYNKWEEVAVGGNYRRWYSSHGNWKYGRKLEEETGFPERTLQDDTESSKTLSGPFVFEPIERHTTGSTGTFGPMVHHMNFYEVLEALAEAVKNGGYHPECPVPHRPMPEEPATTKEAAAEKDSWAGPKPCNVTNYGQRRDVKNESKHSLFPPQLDAEQGMKCGNLKLAQASKDYCESLYQRKPRGGLGGGLGDEQEEMWNAPCRWVPNLAPSPYAQRCFPCDEVSKARRSINDCGTLDEDRPETCPSICLTPRKWPSRQTFTLLSPCEKFLNVWGFCGCENKHRFRMEKDGKLYDSIDCRGCGEKALKPLIGNSSCSSIAPSLHPAMCLALKAFGASDNVISKITLQPHWAHGKEYVYEGRATCVAAGDPLADSGCESLPFTFIFGDTLAASNKYRSGGIFAKPIDKLKNALFCAGDESVAGIYAGGGYGAWGAQAEQLLRAINNGGEHPSCPQRTIRPGVEPCIEAQEYGKQHDPATWWHLPKMRDLCDTDCKLIGRPGVPGRSNSAHKPFNLSCGLSIQFPALRGPDAFIYGSNTGEMLGRAPGNFAREAHLFWMCKEAGYKTFASPAKWGPDDLDTKVLGQDYKLYRTEVFGRSICSENRKDMCGEVGGSCWGKPCSTEFYPLTIPGCRRDISPTLSRSTVKGTVEGWKAVCSLLNVTEEKPNRLQKPPRMGGDTCSRNMAEQPAFECMGPLADLKPGASMRWGFRCKKDEERVCETDKFGKCTQGRPWPREFPKGSPHTWPSNTTPTGFPIPRQNKSEYHGMAPWQEMVSFPQYVACAPPLRCDVISPSSSRLSRSDSIITATGRFSPGNHPVKTCVRQSVRCNGYCNCQDCSDEEECDRLPLMVGGMYDTMGEDLQGGRIPGPGRRRRWRTDENRRRRRRR